MGRLTVQLPGVDDAKTSSFSDRHLRSVQATSPDTCPPKVLLAELYTASSQSCGKCVPCFNGIPLMIVRLQKMIDFTATERDLAEFKSYATMASKLSDCAVGYDAGSAALEFLDTFASEFEAHVKDKHCPHEDYRMVPCETLCPAHVKIPAYIALAGEGDFAGAVNMVRRDNPFPTACGLICEHPCEERCRRTIIDAPINIRGIKKYAVDQRAADTVKVPDRLPETGKRVAVIGGGPSGMTCAYFLSLMGHSVKVFEMRKQLGGMLRYGIPAYRFPRERLDEDINGILSAGGIEVETECYVDEERMRQIHEEYDAVYVAIGAQVGKVPGGIEGLNADGVVSAVDLLGKIGDNEYPDFTGQSVAVIGGGNVAMDCARTAIRANAKEVNIIYRRRREDMTALSAEVESAVAEGIELVTLEAPTRIELDENGHCRWVVTQPQYIGPVKRGRPAPVAANKPENRIPADVVLAATGQGIVSEPFEAFGMEADYNVFRADPYLASKIEGVYVGGDCQTGPKTAIRAIGAGKVAAYNIDDYLGFDHQLDCGVEAPEPKANNRTPTGRVEISERPARVRKCDFDYVEVPMTPEEAVQECGRCLRCDCYGYLSESQREVTEEVRPASQIA